MADNLILVSNRAPRADAVKNRELLIETARRLFAEKGVDSVTMSDVAEAAGVGKGTLYRHFPSKLDLCHIMIDNDQRDLQDRTLARLRAGGDPQENLEWFLGEVVAFLSRNQAIAFAEAAQTLLLDHPAHLWWRQTIRGLLGHLRAGGNPQLDVEYTTDIFFVMLDPRTIHYQTVKRGYSFDQIATSLVALLRQFLR